MSNPTTPTRPDMDAIEARMKAATPGPWVVMIGGYLIKAKHDSRYPEGQCEILVADTINFNNPSFHPIAEYNAAFIANAPADVSALLEYARRLERQVAFLETTTRHYTCAASVCNQDVS